MQNFLARIYTDENLRREFFDAPQNIGKINNLSETEIAELSEILPAELNFFAESVVWKRLRETEKLLPLTGEILAESFVKLFREFAPTFNVPSDKKALEDAVAFTGFLQQKVLTNLARNAAKFERSKLIFYSGKKDFVFAKFDFDIRELASRANEKRIAQTDFKSRKTFAVWLRFSKMEKHFIW